MKKFLIKPVFATMLGLACSQVLAANSCTYKPDEKGFGFSFTAFGAVDKSYVVSKNQFKDYKIASTTGKLKGATIEIQTSSVDTSHDMNNGMGGVWGDFVVPIRDKNVADSLFANFSSPVIKGKILDIKDDKVLLEVDMNGVKRTVAMKFTIDDKGIMQAQGVLDIIDFNGKDAFAEFDTVCSGAWHKGKSWSDVEIEFHVPVVKNCK